MNDQSEITCPKCGKSYQPDLATGLGGGCPHCFARMLVQENEEEAVARDSLLQLAAGDILGGVEILEPLARGGMGVVYKARQLKLNRLVAVKIIEASLVGSREFTLRFEREARALAVLNHPNVVQIFDFGHEDDLCYLVMEWVDGTTLREILAAGHLSPDDALRYVPQICDALEYAHAQGVVHRDIKPENILINRQGQIKIADFGIARLRGDDDLAPQVFTRTGQMMGTPQYMAPEQQKHTDKVDHRADLYSLGVVFYEMLTGELPLGRFPAPSERVKVDVTLDEVVIKTLEHDPNRRYQRASDIKQALTTSAQASTAVAVAPITPKRGVADTSVSGYAWASLACSMMTLIVLWEMTRSWIIDPDDLDRTFFTGESFMYVLRPVSILSVVLTWFFGSLALGRIRQCEGRLTGRRLAITSMFAPLWLLSALLLGMWIPVTQAISTLNVPALISNVPKVFFVGMIMLVVSVLLFLGLRSIFWKLRRYATDPKAVVPVKAMVATVVITLLFGTASWVVSVQRGEARWYHNALREVMQIHSHKPSYGWDNCDQDGEQWTYYTSHRRVLEGNMFGDVYLENLDCLPAFEYERVRGERLMGWMLPSRTEIHVLEHDWFRDFHGYLWIHEFELEGGVLKVKYEFAVGRNEKRQGVTRDDAELARKEEEIRTTYGVEPDTVFLAEIPVKELKRYMTYGMDKQFWQSAMTLEER